MNEFFVFLEKFEQIFVVPCGLHFPYAEPFIEIVSYNFKTTPYAGANWSWEPLFLIDRTIKHFKNISRKICSCHCFLYRRHIYSIENNSMSQNKNLCFNLTHIYDEGFCVTKNLWHHRLVTRAWASVTSLGYHKNFVTQNPHHICV